MRSKRFMTKALRGGIVAAALTAASLAMLPATAAQAAGNASCSFNHSEYQCSTGSVTPNSRHQVRISATPTWPNTTTTCRAYDAYNGIQVGSVSSSRPWIGSTKTISGLYGTYFLVCSGQRNGSGGGQIIG